MKPSNWRGSLAKGFTAGILCALCMWGAAAGWLLVERMQALPLNTAAPPEASPSPVDRRPTQPVTVVTLLPSTPQPLALRQAERAFLEKRLGDVKNILLPALTSLQTPADLAHAYQLMGDAELEQGHYQLAAIYYEGLYQNEPTPENLILLAQAYDSGGSLEAAYQKYLLLTSSNDDEVDPYRPAIDQRLKDITDVLRKRHKGTLPAPLPTLTPQTSP
jgi:tetratricopeptide (TPR) repeat protein